MRPTLQRCYDELERFMEWPTEDRSFVSATSTVAFAEHMCDPLLNLLKQALPHVKNASANNLVKAIEGVLKDG